MPATHSTETDPDLHEPKGAASATADTTYHSDGAGTGTWKYPIFTLTVLIDDLSTSDSEYVVVPYDATLVKAYSVIKNAITTPDATISLEANAVAVTNGDITVAFTSSAAGDVDSSTPTANNTVLAGEHIKVITDGASVTTCKTWVTLVLQRT
jgi:hypothetical protein